jgi:tetratricopeptide (TPR) repeat protein
MYSQILKEILLEIKYDEQSIKDFAAYCRNQCFSSHMDLKSVDEFEKDYHHQSSIWWYTSPTFIYSMLNRALRTQELDTIIKMGFFICDLHRHIEQLHTDEFKNRLFEPYTVYRGQGICKTDFDKMIRSKGGLMSFNNFLSTSTDQIISLTFAHSNATHSGMIGIFFEITIEPTVSSVHFAHLDNISYYKDLEQEILFSMHTVFRIGEINQIDKSNDQLWHVKLTLTNDNDQQLKALTEYMRKNITGYNGWNRLTQLLILLGEYDKAEQIIQILFDSTCNDSQKGTLYNQLGAIKRGQGDFMKALSFYQDFLKSAEQIRPVCDHNIGVACSAIGELYGKMGTYSEALYFHEKALVIQEKILDSNDPTLATSYSNIAITFENTAEYAKAILYQEKALRIKEKILPQNHPDLAISYNIMGILYESLGKYAEALPLYQKVLVIREKSLPPQHPSILVSCENIAKSYSRLQQYTQAIFYLEKAQEICHKIYPPNHPDFCHVYVLSGSIYDDMNQSSKALSYYEKVLEIHEKTPPLNQVELAEFYNNIGLVYAKTRKYSKALLFHDKALEIRHKTLPANHPDFGQSYNNIGSTYSSMGEYSKALSNFQKSLEIKQKTLPPNHPSIKITCSNITSLYNMITKK